MRIRSLLAVLSASPIWAATAVYVGADACGRCHPAEFRAQSASAHARALFPAAKHPMASRFPSRVPWRRPPDFEFRMVLEKRGLLVRIAEGDRAIVLPLEWAFGAGDQAVTFVTRTGASQYLEFYFSYFPAAGGMGITPGQENIEVHNLAESAGYVHRDLDAMECFQCHSTGPVDISGGTFQPHETGVRCEACHGPGSDHAQDPGRVGIRNPRLLSSDRLNEFCGRCHRSPPGSGEFDWSNPWNVRFEPAYLGRSACFRKSDGRLSCLSCHGAHGPLREDTPAHYNAVCAGCHPTAHRNRALTGCVECHMPAVTPREPLKFANHWIGIYREGKIRPDSPETVARPNPKDI